MTADSIPSAHASAVSFNVSPISSRTREVIRARSAHSTVLEVPAASPNSGVHSLTGERVPEALAGGSYGSI